MEEIVGYSGAIMQKGMLLESMQNLCKVNDFIIQKKTGMLHF